MQADADQRVLVVNAGSTSLKLSVVAGDDTSEPVPSLQDARLRARTYTREHGDDDPAIRDWTWPY